ncbi:MAG: 16S rRNA processing protein RimM [Saprospiraceae bacterium]|nr:16S rRNA processing protein RimM [Saprospiraceae bacterium]
MKKQKEDLFFGRNCTVTIKVLALIDFIKAGMTLKAHGLNGELEIKLEDELRDEILKQGVLFIYKDGNYIPYFIESHRDEGRFFIQFEDVHDPEHAKLLSHKEIFTDNARIPDVVKNNMENTEFENMGLTGYVLMDITSGRLGHILSIQEFPGQWMAEVESGGQIFHIPLHEHFIVILKPEEELITVQLPEGIWEL